MISAMADYQPTRKPRRNSSMRWQLDQNLERPISSENVCGAHVSMQPRCEYCVLGKTGTNFVIVDEDTHQVKKSRKTTTEYAAAGVNLNKATYHNNLVTRRVCVRVDVL